HVEHRRNPGSTIEAVAERAPQIREAGAQQFAVELRRRRSEENSEYADIRIDRDRRLHRRRCRSGFPVFRDRGHRDAVPVRTTAITDRPGRKWFDAWFSSRMILTGTRCVTLVKLPVALSGGNRANCDPLAGAMCDTLPFSVTPGYSSMRISARSPS